MVTIWDLRQASRALAFGALALGLAWLVTAATDEGGVPWPERAARTLPLAPVCAALGTWLAQARGWARGEGRTLAALGRAPLVASAPAVLGSALVAWAAAAAILLSSKVDVGGFFPVARRQDAYVSEGDGVFVDTTTGDRIERDGTIVKAPHGAAPPRASTASNVPRRGRLAASLSTWALGLALTLLVARAARGAKGLLLGLVAACAAASTLLFHAAAAHVVDALAAPLPALALLAVAVVSTGSLGRSSLREGS